MNEPKVEITDKGFKIIPVTIEQVLSWGGLGICDSCNLSTNSGKYIGVLNSYYCQECFDRWHKGAINYPDDRPYEDMHIEDMLFRININ